jgi:flagellar basal body-associated protein FliL
MICHPVSMPVIFKKIRHRALRISLLVVLVLVILAGLLIAFISPIAKYLIERDGEKYTGRKITLSWIYVNPFSGHIHAHNLLMTEHKSQEAFIKLEDVAFDVSIRKLLQKTLDVSAISLTGLWLNINENKASFNFDDLFKKDTLAVPKKKSAPFQYYFHDIHLANSQVYYSENTIPVHYHVSHFNASCPNIQWDSDTASFNYDFNFLDKSGLVKGMYSMNFHSLEYHFNTHFSDFNLKSFDQYILEFSKYGNFEAMLNADVDARGNFKEVRSLLAKGKMDFSNFHFGKEKNDDYLRFSKLSLDIDSLSPLNKKYFFNTILLDSVFVKYQLFDSLDNFSHMVGNKGEHITQAVNEHYNQNIVFQVAHFISQLAKDAVNSDYRIDSLRVSGAKALFDDYALEQKFGVCIDPIEITAQDIDTRSSRLFMELHSTIKPYGDLHVKFNANPTDFGDFKLTYQLGQLPLPALNPFAVTYTAFPYDEGVISLSGNWQVLNKKLNSTNHLLCINPTLARCVKNDDANKLPMKVILFFARDAGRKIDLDIPINGDLSNPNYHLWPFVLQVLKNALVKPPVFPYKYIKTEVEKRKQEEVDLEWALIQTDLRTPQIATLRRISAHMILHPSEKVTITPTLYKEKELEMLAMYEGKRRYYAAVHKIALNKLRDTDSVAVFKFSIKDKGFKKFLDQHTDRDKLFTVQDKCVNMLGKAKVEELYGQLMRERTKEIKSFFTEGQRSRIAFAPPKEEIPATGFSHFKFVYSKSAE